LEGLRRLIVDALPADGAGDDLHWPGVVLAPMLLI
jgi:hypothetical protein